MSINQQLKSSEVRNIERQAESMRACRQVRQKIAQLVSRADFRQAHDGEAMTNYAQLLRGDGFIKLDDFEGLQSIHTFIEEEQAMYEDFQETINHDIQQAIIAKDISIKDVDFYKNQLSKNIFNGQHNVDEDMLKEAEEDLKASLEKRAGERKNYHAIANHSLVKKNVLQIEGDKTFDLVSEDDYLKMKVPERRQFLKQAEEALKQAEEYFETQESVESPQIRNEYQVLLKDAQQSEKIIGRTTVNKYLTAFDELDSIAEKKHWLQELENGNELARYRDLWTEARENLQGGALQKMENLRDQLGHTKLSALLERTKENEASRLDSTYYQKLTQARLNGWISKSTMKSFLYDLDGIKNQDLRDKYEYVKQFDDQMAKYKDLYFQIDQLPDKNIRKELLGMYNQEGQGFTEINDKYEELAESAGVIYSPDLQGSVSPLNVIEDPARKQGIIESVDLLDTTEKKTRMWLLVRRMIKGKIIGHNDQIPPVETSSVDESNQEIEISHATESPSSSSDMIYFKKISEKRKQKKEGKRGLFARFINANQEAENDDSIADFQSNLKEKRVNKQESTLNVDQGSDQSSRTLKISEPSKKSPGRQMTVGINEEEELDELLRRDHENSFDPEKKDELRFIAYLDSGKEVDLGLIELRAMEKYLRQQLHSQKLAA